MKQFILVSEKSPSFKPLGAPCVVLVEKGQCWCAAVPAEPKFLLVGCGFFVCFLLSRVKFCILAFCSNLDKTW